MTIANLTTKLDEKTERIAELAKRIKSAEADIFGIEQQMDISVKQGEPDCAVDLLRQKRAKEDELQILRQVMDNIRTTPIISPVDIKEAWSQCSTEYRSEMVNTALPKLQEAYEQYIQAAEAIFQLRQRAHIKAKQLDTMARQENVQVHLNNPFDGFALVKDYWPGKTYIPHLNCVSVPILNYVDTRVQGVF